MGAPLADGKREIRVKTARQGELRRGMITNTHTHRQEKFGDEIPKLLSLPQ